METVIAKVDISKNPVGTSETFVISVVVKEITPDPAMYRLPYTLGKEKGGIR